MQKGDVYGLKNVYNVSWVTHTNERKRTSLYNRCMTHKQNEYNS